MSRSDNLASVLAQFQRDTASHSMEIVQDSGQHRHLRFRRPGTYCYAFDIVTWHGHLAISGDMGAAMFTRRDDMFAFFRADPKAIANAPGGLPINSGYWAEKCVANDGEMKEFRAELFQKVVKERFDEFLADHTDDEGTAPAWAGHLWSELESEVLCEEEDCDLAIERMSDFKPEGEAYAHFHFSDAWEYGSSMEDFRFHFIWRLYAISYAVQAYDRAMASSEAVNG